MLSKVDVKNFTELMNQFENDINGLSETINNLNARIVTANYCSVISQRIDQFMNEAQNGHLSDDLFDDFLTQHAKFEPLVSELTVGLQARLTVTMSDMDDKTQNILQNIHVLAIQCLPFANQYDQDVLQQVKSSAEYFIRQGPIVIEQPKPQDVKNEEPIDEELRFGLERSMLEKAPQEDPGLVEALRLIAEFEASQPKQEELDADLVTALKLSEECAQTPILDDYVYNPSDFLDANAPIQNEYEYNPNDYLNAQYVLVKVDNKYTLGIKGKESSVKVRGVPVAKTEVKVLSTGIMQNFNTEAVNNVEAVEGTFSIFSNSKVNDKKLEEALTNLLNLVLQSNDSSEPMMNSILVLSEIRDPKPFGDYIKNLGELLNTLRILEKQKKVTATDARLITNTVHAKLHEASTKVAAGQGLK